MNFCGPGTNVWKRIRDGVHPVDALDELCYRHDLDVEPRGPYYSKGKRHLLRASDKRLIAGCKKLMLRYPKDLRLPGIIAGIQLVLDLKVRGR